MKRTTILLAGVCGIMMGVLGVATSTAVAQSADPISLYVGVTQYPNPDRDSLVLVEFPFSIKRHEFEFFPADSPMTGLQARVFAQVTLLGVDGMPVDSAYTYFTLRAADSEDALASDIRLFNRLALAVEPGLYSARLIVIDVSSKRQGESFIDQIPVMAPRRDRMTLSDIQYAYRVRSVKGQEAVNARLVRNGYEVLPNPLAVFGTEDSLVYIYAEAYNLTGEHAPSGKFRLRMELLNEDSTLFADLGGRVADKPGPSMVIVESFRIDDWNPGLYFVRLSLYDGMSDSGAVRVQPFQIISREELQARVRESEQFDPYDTLSAENKINLAHYLLTPDQRETMKSLTDQGKLNYLSQFWKDRDPDPYTPLNEYRAEIISRFEYANRMFSTNAEKDNGWRTDRGRIYLSLGAYDQIYDQQAPMSEDPPYQVWYYFEEEQGLYFVFEDEYRDNQYELVHSNDPKEVWNRDWEDRIGSGTLEWSQ